MASSSAILLVKLTVIAAAICAVTATKNGFVQRTSSIVTDFLDDAEVLPTYSYFSTMEHRILSNHWLRGQSGGGCADACPWCVYWGPRYCQPGWIFKGRPVGTYWCPKACNKCSGGSGPVQGRTYKRARQNQAQDSSPPPTQQRTGGGSTGGDRGYGVGDYAHDLLNMVNQGRAENGASPLCLNSKLSAAALGHCQDMAGNDYFAHDSEDGTKFNERIKAAGYQATGWLGENIAMGYSQTADVYMGWRQSPGHWKNIIKREFNQMGIARVDSSGGAYWCQEFGQSDVEGCTN